MTISGWLNIDKELGLSSFGVIKLLKRALPKSTKIGHAGTLDPAATGVLPIAIGEATKLIQFIMDDRKKYYFKVQFGIQTDSADQEGEVIGRCDSEVKLSDIERVISKFIGNISQTPPKYSALKINGVRAYELARKGEEFELKNRFVTIYQLNLLDFNVSLQQASFEVKCSKGTYVRTLAEDIAKELQNLAFVLELRRLEVGSFKIDNSIPSKQLHNLLKSDLSQLVSDKMQRAEIALDDIPAVEINDDLAIKIRHGQKILCNVADYELCWLKHGNNLVAVGKFQQGIFYSVRVFN